MTVFIVALNLLFLFGIAVILWRKQDQAVRPVYWPALGVKLLAGIGLGLIYQYYYSAGDTFYFFDQARNPARLFQTDSQAYFNFLWQDADEEWKGSARSAFFVKIISLISILTGGNYWITSLWFSMISFLGSLYLVKCIVRFFPDAKWSAALAFLFFPSVVFWGSGVIKESVGLAGLLVLSGMFLKAMMNKMPGPLEFFFGLVSFWIVWNLKYYWIAVFLPVVVTSWAVHFASARLPIPFRWKLICWPFLFILLCLGASLTHPNFYLERFLQVVLENNQAFVAISDPGELIHYDSLEATWISVIRNAPWALVSGLFRPFLSEGDSLLKVAVSLENTLILLLCLASLGRIREFLRSPNRLITLTVIVYTFLLCIFLALSTPNLGSLARYKVGFIPFLIFLVTYKNPVIQRLLSLFAFKRLKRD